MPGRRIDVHSRDLGATDGFINTGEITKSFPLTRDPRLEITSTLTLSRFCYCEPGFTAIARDHC